MTITPTSILVTLSVFTLLVFITDLPANRQDRPLFTKTTSAKPVARSQSRIWHWEYRIDSSELSQDKLNELGQQGWELCGDGTGRRSVFKRLTTLQ
jgi:hypothetical protein